MNKKEEQKDKRLFKTYGITLKEFNEQLKKQGGGCWVCGRQDGRLCLDHIHVKGFAYMSPEEKKKYVRGIVCFYCNTGFKGFERTKYGERNRKQLEGTYKYFLDFKLKGEI